MFPRSRTLPFLLSLLLLPSSIFSAKITTRKTTRTFSATRVTLTTPWTASTVLQNLDLAVNRAAYDVRQPLPPLKNRSEFEALVEAGLGPSGFALLNLGEYDSWMRFWFEPLGRPTPILRRYTIGSPLIGTTTILRDSTAILNDPTDVVIIGDYGLNGTAPDDGPTTKVMWDIPSGVIAIDGKGKPGTEQYALWYAARAFDERLEILLRDATGN